MRPQGNCRSHQTRPSRRYLWMSFRTRRLPARPPQRQLAPAICSAWHVSVRI